MQIFKKLQLAVLMGVLSAPAFAVTQTITTSETHQYWYQNSGIFEIGRLTLQFGTQSIDDLDTSVTLVDQGWGFQSAEENAVFVGLYHGETQLYNIRVAGATHELATQTYDLAANADDYNQLNAALDQYANTGYPNLTLRFYTHAVGYLGWELHTSNDSLAVVTTVPEPGEYAMMLAGFGVLGAVHWRRRRAAAEKAI